jgi:hypothetical protein
MVLVAAYFKGQQVIAEKFARAEEPSVGKSGKDSETLARLCSAKDTPLPSG